MHMKQISDKVMLALRRCKTKGKQYTVKDILQEHETIVKLDDGYKIFKTLRNSPPYLEKRQKDLMAMIRQLGCPTYFVSLSAADTKWADLLRILDRFIDNKEYTDVELENMDWSTKTRLVQSDPVTCVRYFDHRLQTFVHDILKDKLHPIGCIKDFFIRIEFQQRGSPHAHIMFWIERGPIFGKNTHSEIVSFIDKLISCSSNVKDSSKPFLEMQQPKHSKTCRKKSKAICRFGFPKPPMQTTMLLEPPDTQANIKDDKVRYEKIADYLDQHKDGIDLSFAEFLDTLKLTYQQYISALRTSIKTPAVFLKRDPSDIRVNPYMKNILEVYAANHDIQYITDPYACAVYIVAYMSKSQRGMSNLMAQACRETRNGNLNLRQQVRNIGNKFLNTVEVSAQEAVYLLLQLPITRSSRSVVLLTLHLQLKELSS
ncbi:hypothetical protein HOLleu_01668 [Holothuria leucospilota]|uniref:Helitron helicase-like domain-containing protein n=1 Tax=Holothuria leucospilota TaxID=206669 RepID=A0A9Q1CPB4_HOLLE|nr:hypothetical protein HOLleu_01668 [Holothuria leucospilota]